MWQTDFTYLKVIALSIIARRRICAKRHSINQREPEPLLRKPDQSPIYPDDGQDFACDLAQERDAKLLVLNAQKRRGSHVIPEELKAYEKVEHLWATEADLLKGSAQSIVDAACEFANQHGVSKMEGLVVEGDPAKAIVDTARLKSADTIVLGSRGLGDFQGFLLGSVSHKVSSAAPCTCIVVR